MSAEALRLLTEAHDALAGMSDSDLDHFEDEEEELEAVPMQYAARKVMAAMQALQAGSAAPLPEGMVTADFPIIAMGHGKVEVGDAEWEGLPALWFGNEGKGLGVETVYEPRRAAKDRETLVLFTFVNLQGLEAIEAAVARVRAILEARK